MVLHPTSVASVVSVWFWLLAEWLHRNFCALPNDFGRKWWYYVILVPNTPVSTTSRLHDSFWFHTSIVPSILKSSKFACITLWKMTCDFLVCRILMDFARTWWRPQNLSNRKTSSLWINLRHLSSNISNWWQLCLGTMAKRSTPWLTLF